MVPIKYKSKALWLEQVTQSDITVTIWCLQITCYRL